MTGLRPVPLAALVAAGLLVAAAAAAPAAVAAPRPFSAQTIDGPSAAIFALGDVTLARDGTGGVIFLESAAGAEHVFANVESDGRWGGPQQLDAGLPGAASQPVIAAAQSGRIAAVFVSHGSLYGTVLPTGGHRFGTPQPIAANASDPALGISSDGTAYVSFTAPVGAVSGVYYARLDRTSTVWQTYTTPLNLSVADNAAFNAATRSQIAVATDGTALVTWGETEADGLTHVIARRVASIGPSDAPQDLNLPGVDGLPGQSADSPSVTLEDVADFGWVVFRQTFGVGTGAVSLTVARHQYGSQFDPPEPVASGYGDKGPTLIDPFTLPTTDGADDPQVEMDGSGDGFATEETTVSHEAFGDPLNDPYFTAPVRLDTAADAIAPQPVVAVGGIDDVGAAAWLEATTATAPATVFARSWNGTSFGAPALLSVPGDGGVPTGPGALSAAADHYGDVLVAFLQGAPTATRVQVAGFAEPPQPPALSLPARTSSTRPLISWSAAADALGIASYTVAIDGVTIGRTTATSLRPPAALSTGSHTVLVTATNRYGATARSSGSFTITRTGATGPTPTMTTTTTSSTTPSSNLPGTSAPG